MQMRGLELITFSSQLANLIGTKTRLSSGQIAVWCKTFKIDEAQKKVLLSRAPQERRTNDQVTMTSQLRSTQSQSCLLKIDSQLLPNKRTQAVLEKVVDARLTQKPKPHFDLTKLFSHHYQKIWTQMRIMKEVLSTDRWQITTLDRYKVDLTCKAQLKHFQHKAKHQLSRRTSCSALKLWLHPWRVAQANTILKQPTRKYSEPTKS